MTVRGFYLVSRDEDKAKEVDIFRALNKDVVIELVNFEDVAPMTSDDGKIYVSGRKVDCPDFVFVRAFKIHEHAYQFEAVMNLFESLGAVCINSMEARRITRDKLLSNQIALAQVPEANVPKTMLITPDSDIDFIGETIGFPLVLKAMHGSKGLGVTLVKDADGLKSILDIVMAAPFGDQLIAQQAIMSSRGRDARLTVVFGQVVGAYSRVNSNEFRSNIHQGGHSEGFEPSPALKDVAIKLADAFDLKMGGIDFLFGEKPDEFWFCEANSLIGMSDLLKNYGKGDLDALANFEGLDKRFLEMLKGK